MDPNHQTLQEAFVDTFLDELLPGIFHNYANPLNGIMGRSKLLQRRLADFMRTLEERYPDAAAGLGEPSRKILSDIQSINEEAEKFYDLFRLSTGKFYSLGTLERDRLDLSALVETELGFADFYLDFKHQVAKAVHLERELPAVQGVAAHLSMGLWMLLRLAMTPLKGSKAQPLEVTTGREGDRAFLRIHPLAPPARAEEARPLQTALALLETAADGVTLTHSPEGTLTLWFPCRAAAGGARG